MRPGRLRAGAGELAPPEISYIINDAGAEVLFVGADHVDTIEGIRSELKTVRKIVALDGGHAAWDAFEAWRDAGSPEAPGHHPSPDDVAVQMYTSGTTGRPKGAQLTHHNLTSQLRHGKDELGNWHEDDVSQIVMPQFHIAGTAWGMVGLYVGAKGVVLRDIDPPAVLECIARDRITKVFYVPAVILFLLQVPGCAGTDFSSLELIVYGASPMPLDLLENAMKVFGCGFAQVYGLTETSGAITYLPPEDHRPGSERMKSCGKPYGGVDIRIVDEAGNPLGHGEIGEVATRSGLNTSGYYNLPEATEAAFQGGWFRTGDAGYMDADGYLYIYDRVMDMIISGGENIYPAEVEEALFAHPAVADVAVIGVPDSRWGEAVKAAVIKKSGEDVTEHHLIDFARQRIAHYKAPKSVDFVTELPRNPSGKVLKRELRKPYWEGRERGTI